MIFSFYVMVLDLTLGVCRQSQSRGYRYKSILCAFERVNKLDRSTALQKPEKKSVDRIALPVVFVF